MLSSLFLGVSYRFVFKGKVCCESKHRKMETRDETLRQQFQALQEQQQKKLMRRKQRQEEKNKKEAASKEGDERGGPKTKEGSNLGALGLNDDLDLKVSGSSPLQISARVVKLNQQNNICIL